MSPSKDTKISTQTAANKPTIVFVTTRLGGGGAEKHLIRIANVLTDQFTIHIAVLRSKGSYETLANANITIHHVGPNWAQHSTLLSAWFGISSLANLISKLDPKCLVSFLEPASYATHFAKLRLKNGIPHLMAIQNNFSRAMESFTSLLKRPIRKGITQALKDADGIVAISNGVAVDVAQHLPEIKAKTTTIYNAAFTTPPSVGDKVKRCDRKPYQLVACGRLTEQKGFEDLLEAIHLVSQRIDVGLWILGVGPLEETLKTRARDLGINDRVSFLGFENDPLPFFASADAFVLSSKWEGFGNVIVEAMSVSAPVVSTACPYGPDEIIEHGVSGFLVPVDDPDKLAGGIATVLTDLDLRQQLAAGGRIRSNDFSATIIASQYADLINQHIYHKIPAG